MINVYKTKNSEKSSIRQGQTTKQGPRAQGFSSFQTIVFSVIAFSFYDFFLNFQVFMMDGTAPSISSEIKRALLSQECSALFPLLNRTESQGLVQLQACVHRPCNGAGKREACVHRPCSGVGKREGSCKIAPVWFSFSFDCIQMGLTKKIE